MSDLPASVRIGPYKYSVAEVEIVSGDNWAYIAYESRSITIKAGLSDCAKRVALMHEVQHGVNELAGLSAGKHREETYTSSSAPILLDTLQRNPALVAFLLDGAT